MDPNACLQRFLRALSKADYLEAEEAQEDLDRWLEDGGFEPDWNARERKVFYGFVLPSNAGIDTPTTEEIEEDLEERVCEEIADERDADDWANHAE